MKGQYMLKPYSYQNLLVLWWKHEDPRPSPFKILVNNVEVPKPLLGIAFTNNTECLLIGLVDNLLKIKTAAVKICDESGETLVASSRRVLRPFTERDMRTISIEDRLRIWRGLLTTTHKMFPSVSRDLIQQIASATALIGTSCAETTENLFYFRTAWPYTETSQLIDTSIKVVMDDGRETREDIKSLVETSWVHCVMPMPQPDSCESVAILQVEKGKSIPLKIPNAKQRVNQKLEGPTTISHQHIGDKVALSDYLQHCLQNKKIQALALYDPDDDPGDPVFIKIDSATIIPDLGLFIRGWIVNKHRLKSIDLHRADAPEIDLLQHSIRVPKPDIHSEFREQGIFLTHCSLGFHSLIRNTGIQTSGSEINFTIQLDPDLHYRLPSVETKTLDSKAPLPIDISFSLIEMRGDLKPGIRLEKWAPCFKSINNWAMLSDKDLHIDSTPSIKEPIHFSVDTAIIVPNTGLFLAGWKIDLGDNIQSMQVIDVNGTSVQILDNLILGSRPDVYDVYSKQGLALVNDELGFHCLAPIKMEDHTNLLCHLKISCVTGEVYRLPLKAEVPKFHDPLPFIKKILLTFSPTHPALRHLLNECVGPAVTSLWQERRLPVISLTVKCYGELPNNPEVSIIVPLYGRIDFVLHQLSLFADDSDFQNNELIYVLDDPRLCRSLEQTCHDIAPLFNVPFKLIHGKLSLGFAGANNLGAQYAHGKYLLLLNSDVMPKEHGWIRRLTNLYKRVPKAGVMGTKLLYADGSIQHAGMAFERLPDWGGLWVNNHPAKGQANQVESDAKPVKITAVTAACLMVEKAIYERVGGFAEDYIIGDFEDSDLCFKIQAAGYQNWYAPSVELYHLERQSQLMPDERHWRTQLTLYNCWTHNAKWKDQIDAAMQNRAKQWQTSTAS